VKGEPKLEWGSEAVCSELDDVLQMRHDKSKRSEAQVWLEKKLENGSVPSTELKEWAHEEGYSWATVRRAQEQLQIKPDKSDFNGGWLWQLPKMLINGEDAHHSELNNFDNIEHLRAETPGSPNCISKD